MPLIIPSNSISAVGYDVANSLRFNSGSSDYLSTTTGTATNTDKCTISFWVKRGFKSSGDHKIIANYTDANNRCFIFLGGDDNFHVFQKLGGSTTISLKTTRLFRDYSAWYHFVVVVDTSQATTSNRIKIYANGVQETSFVTETYPSQNENFRINESSVSLNIGRPGTDTEYFNGYLSEFVLLDGQALDPTSFGEFDEDTGIWKPIDVSELTFGNNGFYLDFENSGSLGADVSGNGNNFTVNNLTSIDQTTDTCTNNYAVGNSIFGYSGATFSEGNNKMLTTISGYETLLSTIAFSSGKWYAEFKIDSASSGRFTVGISETEGAIKNMSSSNDFGSQSQDYGYFGNGGTKYNNNTLTSYGDSFGTGDIIGVAIDLDNLKIYFSKNGTWQNSGDPESGAIGTGSAFNISAGLYFMACGDSSGGHSGTISANFGNPPYSANGYSDANGYGNMSYSVPSGYYILNTKNLAEYG